MNNDKPQLIERGRVYTNLNRSIFTLIGLLVFVVWFPVMEWNTDCPDVVADPDLHETCIEIKSTLWQTVFFLSAYHGDGMALTDSVDEEDGRSVYPLVIIITALVIVQCLVIKKKINFINHYK